LFDIFGVSRDFPTIIFQGKHALIVVISMFILANLRFLLNALMLVSHSN